jgi:asparagine synthase (glutamine-hydrolysing)
MCGICGKFNFDGAEPVPAGLLTSMCDVMVHRGPDDAGYLLDGSAGLGMRRLSIIDLAGGHQPISNEDGSVWVVCNGEIYNFPELRAELERRGHRLKTKTDVETIVHLYEDFGESCVKKLAGMFAFAIWDSRSRTFLLGRDRVGKKPLFYAATEGSLVFGSTLKSVLLDPRISREVDLASLHHYLTYQYVPEPATIFTHVRKLPPAHYLVCEGGKVRVERYWDLSFAEKWRGSASEAAERVAEAVRDAVRVRLISDVPIGAFLSGGIDSTVVVGIMSQMMSQPVKTFSIGFEEAGYNELSYARIAAKRFGTDHHEFVVTPSAVAVLPELVWHFEEPMADSSGIPTYYVAKLTRDHVTVALNGDGGDEGFAGYERYRAFHLARRGAALPAGFRKNVVARLAGRLPEPTRFRSPLRRFKRFAEALAEDGPDRYMRWMTVFGNELKASVYSDEMIRRVGAMDSRQYLRDAFGRCDAGNDLDRLLYTDTMTYLPGDLLVKMDRMSMAHSLEARSPFLDHRVLELAAGLAPELKLRGSVGKYVLKKAAAGMVPDEILRRGKQGFGVPLAKWFRGELKDPAAEILLDARTRSRGYFNPNGIRSLLNEHLSGRADHSHRIWALLVLELWHRTFVDRTDIRSPITL